jgi:hypothetical protein
MSLEARLARLDRIFRGPGGRVEEEEEAAGPRISEALRAIDGLIEHLESGADYDAEHRRRVDAFVKEAARRADERRRLERPDLARTRPTLVSQFSDIDKEVDRLEEEIAELEAELNAADTSGGGG